MTNRHNQRQFMDNQRYYGRFIAPHTVQKQDRQLQELACWHSWCADSGAWAGFKPDEFRHMLRVALPYRDKCLFVAAPDVPAATYTGTDLQGAWKETLDLFWRWHSKIRGYGYPVAICLHPGATTGNIPWDCIDAIFIGGTDYWRYGESTKQRKPLTIIPYLIYHARQLGKHVHVGRMANSRDQINVAAWWGAQTVDGTGETKYPLGFQKWIAPSLRAANGDEGIQRALPFGAGEGRQVVQVDRENVNVK